MKLVIDDHLSCTTVLLLVSIADEEGGHEEAPASPAIVIVVSNRHLHLYHFFLWKLLLFKIQLYLSVKEGFDREGVEPVK